MAFACTYELRDGEAVISTGHLTLEAEPRVGDTVSLGRKRYVVAEIRRGEEGPRLVLRSR
jgi:hypothetical protein